MDTEKSNLITEQLLQAMDIIANKKIENLPFDKTILCTITAIKDKDEGIYEVSANTDSAQANRSYFQAFAQEGATYEVGDNVYVNVPQNDFSNQKTIISKYISEQAKPVNYINPMEQFIKLEEINYTEETNYYGLKANSETQFQYEIFEKDYDLAHMPKNYDCLGISADFTALLGSYKPLDGEYGLRFEFGGLKDGWDTNISDDTDISNINKYLALKEVTFSNREMYGMTYDFFTPSHQEKLINLQDFPYPIKIVRCYFYQNKNFRDINNNKIPGEDYEWDESNKTWKKPIPKENGEEQRYIVIDPDIQMDNLVCTFGYLMSDAKDGDLRLYTTSKIKYSEAKSEDQNKKTLKLRWLLNDEDGNLKAIDELKDKASGEGFTDYSWWENKIIYLYKYTYGKDEVDPYAGPFWERIASYGKYVVTQTIREVELDSGKYKYKPESRLLQIFSSSRNPWGNIDVLNKGVSNFNDPFNVEVDITQDDKDSVFARYKVIILEYTDPIEKNAASNPYTTSIQFDEEASDVVIEPEDVITEGNYRIIDETSLKIYESNEITFENENEVAGRAAMALINGLELECVDGSNGIYRIYGEDNKITAQTNSQSMKLRANFNAINILGLDAGEANITWYYPKNNTMFVSPIDKATARIDVYKPVSVTLNTTTANLSSYYVKVNEQYYSLSSVTIEGTAAVGYTRDGQSYFKADSQTIYQKGKETILAANWNENSDSDYYVLTQNLDNISRIGDSDSITPSNNEIVYTIDSFYASNRTNNTIKCKIERYGREYWAEKEFFFGHQGNNGTNYAFDISLEREYDDDTHKEVSETIVPFLKTNNDNFVKVKATLIYGKEEITDLSKVRWGWEVISKSDNSNNDIIIYDSQFRAPTDPEYSLIGDCIYLQTNNSLNLSKYYAILKAEIAKDVITVDGDNNSPAGSKTRSVTLTTYLPIGISANNNIKTYIGGTSILYNDYGSDPVYYEGEHQLIGVNSTSWEFKNSDNTSNGGSNKYYPAMYKDESGKNYIRPTTMYFSGINNTGRIIVKNGGTIIFVQPIFIAQNAWGNQAINQWDGALKIDSEGNYILSSMLGAGIKNSNNTFSGVLLGQIGKDYNAKTGIYGYGKGVQTYGFCEDGTAFIGASGMGRIEFNTTTDEGIISGGRYSITRDGIRIYTDEYTMEINLSQGKIVGRKHKIDNSEDTLEYVFDAQAKTYPLKIGKLNNEKFKVAWDGTLTATGAHFGNWSDTSGYSNGNDGTIESILQQIANNAKTADNDLAEHLEDTDATVAQHWEPETLFNQSVYWPNKEYIQEKDSNNNLLYWTDSNKQTKTTEDTGIPVMIQNPDYNYFVLTNTDYGTNATHKYYLSKDGSFTANNGVFSGIVTAYAGDFGGWSLAPGILSYDYNMTYVQNNTQNYWTGDFFTNSSAHQNYNIGADPFESRNTATTVSVGSKKAFIYLRNSGNGIGVTGFAGKSVPSTGVTQNASYFLSTNTEKSQPEYGRLKNIIFSLGQNFAVDKDGNLFANAGDFSGKITANSGKIGAWNLTAVTSTTSGGDLYAEVSGKEKIVLDPRGTDTHFTWTKYNASSASKINTYISVGNKFGIDTEGNLYASSAELKGILTADAGSKIGPWTISKTAIYKSSSDFGNNSGMYFGDSGLSLTDKFKVTNAGKITATDADITGTINANSGRIGGWNLTAYTPASGSGSTAVAAQGGLLQSADQSIKLNPIDSTITIEQQNPTNSTNNQYNISTAGSNGNQAGLDWIQYIKKTISSALSGLIQKVVPKFMIKSKDDTSLWSGLNQYGLLIFNSSLKSYYSTGAYIGGNLSVSGTTTLQHLNGTSVNQGGVANSTSWDNNTVATGLSLNTTTVQNKMWRNALYTTLLDYNHHYDSSIRSYTYDNYMSFIRGFGYDSNQPTIQKFIGGKKHVGSISSERDWDDSNDYVFYIQYNGDAYFHSITLGDGTHVVPSYADTNKDQILAVNSNGNGLTWIDKPTSTSVSFTRSKTSGTQIGTITINGTSTTLYCDTDTNTTYSAGDHITISSNQISAPWAKSFSTSTDYWQWNGAISASTTSGTVLTGYLWFDNSGSGSSAENGNECDYGINGSSSSCSFAKIMTNKVVVGGTTIHDSDIRLKINLNNQINLNFYDEIVPYSFTWKLNQKNSFGFIAQDIKELCDKYNLINTDIYYTVPPDELTSSYITDNQQYCINYEKFHALHVAKNHQQDARIQFLESEVVSLRTELQQLKNQTKGE